MAPLRLPIEVWRNIADQAYCLRDAIYISQVDKSAFTACDEAFWKRALQHVGYSLPAEPIVAGKYRTTGSWGNLARAILADYKYWVINCDDPCSAELMNLRLTLMWADPRTRDAFPISSGSTFSCFLSLDDGIFVEPTGNDRLVPIARHPTYMCRLLMQEGGRCFVYGDAWRSRPTMLPIINRHGVVLADVYRAAHANVVFWQHENDRLRADPGQPETYGGWYQDAYIADPCEILIDTASTRWQALYNIPALD